MMIYAMIYDIIIYDDICNDILFDIKNLTLEEAFSSALLKNSRRESCTKNGDMSTLFVICFN